MQNPSTILEVRNLTFTGEIDPSTSCLPNCCDSSGDQYGLILNDISFTLFSGEFCLILGSKGSGKKVLLNTLAQLYSKNSIRGRVLLNYLPLKKYQFDMYCAYVRNDRNHLRLYNGLRVKQILIFALNCSQAIASNSKAIFLQEIYSDFVLNHLTNRFFEHLNESEQKRVLVALQFLKNPIVLLLDEATYNFDPLNTYLMVSILANLSKKYGTIIISTMDRPRSDIFPFIDHVIYLCLGDIVYSGNTRSMLDYFHAIGFPCPEFENPLMYYLCLCTVDRRSRERFLESNHQMSLLIEKFKLMQSENCLNSINYDHAKYEWKTMPSTTKIIVSLYRRFLLMTFQCNNRNSLRQFFWQFVAIPLVYFLVWLIYKNSKIAYQHSFITRTGFVLSSVMLTSLAGILNCVSTYELTNSWKYINYSLSLWTTYMCTIQQTILLENLLRIRKKSTIITLSSIFNIFSIGLSSGMLHAFKSLNEWIYYLTLVVPVRYVSIILGRMLFLAKNLNEDGRSLDYLTIDNQVVASQCNNSAFLPANLDFHCISPNGFNYFQERFAVSNQHEFLVSLLDFDKFNIIIQFAFVFVLILINLFVFSVIKHR